MELPEQDVEAPREPGGRKARSTRAARLADKRAHKARFIERNPDYFFMGAVAAYEAAHASSAKGLASCRSPE